jgi:hypothetical protein
MKGIFAWLEGSGDAPNPPLMKGIYSHDLGSRGAPKKNPLIEGIFA